MYKRQGLSDRVQNFTADFRGINFQIEKWTLAESVSYTHLSGSIATYILERNAALGDARVISTV